MLRGEAVMILHSFDPFLEYQSEDKQEQHDQIYLVSGQFPKSQVINNPPAIIDLNLSETEGN